ncbi:MAG: SDR family NAD(P)-dependent oxidoreductase [Gammaproteobacteria bacterium]|nr:SDR family NAD(P)-dependent oxidoreductase [Gammaproteobacteria bacterium]
MPPDATLKSNGYVPSSDALADRVVLVTGASSGIGRACACACAKVGATVILLARDLPRLEQTYDLIRKAGGPEPVILPLDLNGATFDDYEQVAERIAQDFGRLDGLLHNAGLVGGLRPMRLLEPADWTRLARVNLLAPWFLTQACLPLLDKAEDPAIAFTLDGQSQRPYWGAYGVAKAGLSGLVEILSQELDGDRPIRVNGIDPGTVETRLRRQNYPGEPGGKHAAPEEVAPAFVYFLGSDSRGITGRTVLLS